MTTLDCYDSSGLPSTVPTGFIPLVYNRPPVSAVCWPAPSMPKRAEGEKPMVSKKEREIEVQEWRRVPCSAAGRHWASLPQSRLVLHHRLCGENAVEAVAVLQEDQRPQYAGDER
jgi:hypothetical protein